MSPGHLFIVNGDLTKIACDAVLVPTDGVLNITPAWREFLGQKSYPNHFESRVIRALPTHPKEPHVWLGNLGQLPESWTFSVFEETVREFVEKSVPEVEKLSLDERLYPWPKIRLAVNVIGSGAGGASETKGELLSQLITALGQLAVKHGVDIVLVAYGDKPYAAAQRTRHKLVDRAKLGAAWVFDKRSKPDLLMCARQIADAAITSQLVLFVGAGVSAGAGAPTWNQLLADIARTAGFRSESLPRLAEKDPRDQATLIERRLQEGGRKLRADVATVLQRTTRYSLLHGLLTSLPSSEAVTTNFDDLFETAARTGGRELAVLPENPSTTDGQWLLKLHGTVEDPANIVLTRSDYLDMPREYGALMGLVQGMLLMRHMMFVGYSLQDEDFQELIHEVRKARGHNADGPRGTVLTLFEDELERDIWAKDLNVIPMIAGTRTTATPAEAARELELFLDLIGFLSTTSAPFFLDRTYSYLSEDEEVLRELLRQVAAMTSNAEKGTVAYIVNRFLKGLGSGPREWSDRIRGPRFTDHSSDRRRRPMPETDNEQLEALSAACQHDLGDPDLWYDPEGYPGSLALCIIDSIYSTGAHYSSVVNVVRRYRDDRASKGGNADADGTTELLANIGDFGGPDPWASRIGNRRPTSTSTGAPLKAEAIQQIASKLTALNISTAADLRSAAKSNSLVDAKAAWISTPGQRSGITWDYALMLAKIPGVKADRMVVRYVARAIGKKSTEVSSSAAAALVRQVAKRMRRDVITLDHAIWRFESGRPVNQEGDPVDPERGRTEGGTSA